MISRQHHITVCICTFKRSKLLADLLSKLQHQTTDELFTFSIVVVDNDTKQSAQNIVESFKGKSLIDVSYYHEPERNIALARNKAVNNAKGSFIAFIDDDEIPVKDWLFNLYKTFHKYKSAGVLGPVKPNFEEEPPEWILRGRLCERPSYETGTILSWKNTRTGNVLLSHNVFMNNQNMFDPEFGTGGEDSIFFRKLIEKGHVFVFCNEAPVYESVPSERLKKTYFMRRALLIGAISSKYIKKESFVMFCFIVIKSLAAFFIYTLSLPLLYLVKFHLFMKILIKDCHHIGMLLALTGINIIKERNF